MASANGNVVLLPRPRGTEVAAAPKPCFDVDGTCHFSSPPLLPRVHRSLLPGSVTSTASCLVHLEAIDVVENLRKAIGHVGSALAAAMTVEDPWRVE